MNEPAKPQGSYQESPAVDLRITGEPQPLTIHGYPVVLPDEDINDKIVPIRGKDIKRWRSRLQHILNNSFPWADILLAISMLLLGFYGAVLLSERIYGGFAAVLVNTLVPMFGIGFLVAYFFCRGNAVYPPKHISKELLNDIPDPDKINNKGDNIESK